MLYLLFLISVIILHIAAVLPFWAIAILTAILVLWSIPLVLFWGAAAIALVAAAVTYRRY